MSAIFSLGIHRRNVKTVACTVLKLCYASKSVTNGQTNRRTEERTDEHPRSNMPLQLRSWGHNEPDNVPSNMLYRDNSDQPAHSHSLIRNFIGCILNYQGCKFLHADNGDQTAEIHYENMPIHIYRKFHLPNLKKFRQKILLFFIFLLKA